MNTKVYVAISNFCLDGEANELTILCVTTDKEKAIKALKADFERCKKDWDITEEDIEEGAWEIEETEDSVTINDLDGTWYEGNVFHEVLQ